MVAKYDVVKAWTAEEIALAAEMRAQCQDYVAIGRALKRTPDAIRKKLEKVGRPNTPRLVRSGDGMLSHSPCPERNEELRGLWAQEKPRLSVSEIAERMRLTNNQVVGQVHRMRLPPRGSPIIRDGREVKRSRARRAPQITLPGLRGYGTEFGAQSGGELGNKGPERNAFNPRFVASDPPLNHSTGNACKPCYVVDELALANNAALVNGVSAHAASGDPASPAPATRTCQWIEGTPGNGRVWRFCGAPCQGSWCGKHYRRVFLPAGRRAV